MPTIADPQTTQTTATASGQQQTGSATFTIPPEVVEKYPDLVELVKGSASMNDGERQYWFSIMPIMTQEQINRLREILVTEKNKLAEIDKKYSKQLTDINEKHLIEWQAVKAKESKQKIAQAESAAKGSEEAESAALLGELGDV